MISSNAKQQGRPVNKTKKARKKFQYNIMGGVSLADKIGEFASIMNHTVNNRITPSGSEKGITIKCHR